MVVLIERYFWWNEFSMNVLVVIERFCKVVLFKKDGDLNREVILVKWIYSCIGWLELNRFSMSVLVVIEGFWKVVYLKKDGGLNIEVILVKWIYSYIDWLELNRFSMNVLVVIERFSMGKCKDMAFVISSEINCDIYRTVWSD